MDCLESVDGVFVAVGAIFVAIFSTGKINVLVTVVVVFSKALTTGFDKMGDVARALIALLFGPLAPLMFFSCLHTHWIVNYRVQ